MLAALVISGRDWILPAVGLLIIAAVALVWGYWKAPGGSGPRTISFFLKALGLAILGFCLLEPLWSSQRARPGANFFALLADNSQGMQIKDKGESRSRGENLLDTLNPETASWQTKLEEAYRVRRFYFDTRLKATKDFSELEFEGRASAIGSALQVLGERYRGQPLAGVLMFTDGNATDATDASTDLSGLPPIYPVVVGKDEAIKDISIQKVAVSQTAFEDAPVTIEVTLLPNGYPGASIVAQLFELAEGSRTNSPASTNQNRVATAQTRSTSDGVEKKVAEEKDTVRQDGQPMAFRFQVRPAKTGISFYRLRVSVEDELGQFEDASLVTEATLANNSRMVVVDRGRGPYRILYVAGRPNWEYKFLSRALSEDDEVQLVALIRVAKREPKFNFLGYRGDDQNPLFRGFDTKGEDMERYDQPVLVRLNTVDDAELRGGFPATPEDLYGFHAVIVDDLEAEFFTRDQMALLQKYVSDRGAGFLMLGGMETFHQGAYENTPIEDMLPVYLDRPPLTGRVPSAKKDLTREGMLQPWTRLRDNEREEQSRLEDMPRFEVLNRVRDVKPGASVLATVEDEDGKVLPALIVQRFGRGRTAALTIGDIWKWGMRNETMHRDMDKAWRQLMRWLVADVPERVELVAEQDVADQTQALSLNVRVKDKKFQPLDNADVKLSVRFVSAGGTKTAAPSAEAGDSDGVNSEVPLGVEESLREAGLYESSYLPRETGGYIAEAIVMDSTGIAVGQAEAGWTADPAADEFRSLQPNRALLETIAKKTGGEVISADDLMAFVNGLPQRQAPITETVFSPLWHTPWMFLLALGCFIAEWGLRRWKGLA